MRRVAGETLPLRVMSDPKVTAVPVKQEAAKEEKVEEPLHLPVQDRAATPSPAVERPRRTAAEKPAQAAPITMESYEARYLKPLEKRDFKTDYRCYIPYSVYMQLKSIELHVFDGKMSINTMISNIVSEHIEQHRDFFNTTYKNKSSNHWEL